VRGSRPGCRASQPCAPALVHLLRHPQLGTEHLLLGLLHDDPGSRDTAKVLTASGVTLASVRRRVEEATGAGADPVSGQLAKALRRYGRHAPGCDPGRGCSCGLGDLLALAEQD
jgi:hypothetical protein